MKDKCSECGSVECECVSPLDRFDPSLADDPLEFAEDAGEAVGWALGVSGFGKVVEAAKSLRQTEKGFHEDMMGFYVESIMTDQLKLRNLFDELVEHLGEMPNRDDFVALRKAVDRVSQRTVGAKRERLKAALFNAFRPEYWEEGLSLRLLREFEDLDYPQVLILERTREAKENWNKLSGTEQDFEKQHRTEVGKRKGRYEIRDQIERFLADELYDKKMIAKHNDGSYWTLRDWGEMFLDFVTEKVESDEEE